MVHRLRHLLWYHDQSKHILIISPDNSPLTNQIRSGIMSTMSLESLNLLRFSTFSCHLYPQPDEALTTLLMEHDFTLILAIGPGTSHLARSIITLLRLKIPLVFGGVEHAVVNGIMPTTWGTLPRITGLESSPLNHEHLVQFLLRLRYPIRKVTIVHDTTPFTLPCYNGKLLEHLLTSYNVSVQTIRLSSALLNKTHFAHFYRTHLTDTDILLMLKDSTTLEYISLFADVCNQNGIILCAPHIPGQEHWKVAINYHQSDYQLGVAMAYKALSILLDRPRPAHMQLSQFQQEHSFIIKRAIATQQQITFDCIPHYQSKKVLFV